MYFFSFFISFSFLYSFGSFLFSFRFLFSFVSYFAQKICGAKKRMFKTDFLDPHKTKNFLRPWEVKNKNIYVHKNRIWKTRINIKLKTRLILKSQKPKQDTKTKNRWISQNIQHLTTITPMLKPQKTGMAKIAHFR